MYDASISSDGVDLETYRRTDELFRECCEAVRKAQEESRAMGVPNVYSYNGRLYYELPNGELSLTPPDEIPPSGRAGGESVS